MPWHRSFASWFIPLAKLGLPWLSFRLQGRSHHAAPSSAGNRSTGMSQNEDVAMRMLQYRVLAVSAAVLALAAATGRLAQPGSQVQPAVQVTQYCDPRQHDAPDAPRFYCLDADVTAVGERSAILS